MNSKTHPSRPANAWPSIIYFLFFAAIAALVPFLALYYQSLGLTGGQSGLLLSVPPLITLVALPFWTGLADARKRHWTVLRFTLLTAVIVMAGIPLIRPLVLIFAAIGIFSFFSAPVMALIDSAVLSMLGSQRDNYGRIRLWGTIGWGLSAPLAGRIFALYGLHWMFWVYATLMLLALIPMRRLEFAHSASPTPFWQGLRSILAEPRWVLFMSMNFVTAIGLSTHTNYMSVLMDGMGASTQLVGIGLTISTVFELPVMFYSNTLLKKFKTKGLLSLAMAVTGIRCILYYFTGSPEVVLAIQTLHGLTFPALWVAGVTYASENAPPGLEATAQGLLGSVLMGFGAAAGGITGGLLIDWLGISGMYGVVGLGVLICLAFFTLIDRRTPGT